MSNILVIEDSERIASFIVKGLQSHGYQVTHTTNGEDALKLTGAADFDLVILDIGLPGMDGFAVLEQLRGSGNEVPVIVLTARDSVDNTVASFEGGADDYMSKPFLLRSYWQECAAGFQHQVRQSPRPFCRISKYLLTFELEELASAEPSLT